MKRGENFILFFGVIVLVSLGFGIVFAASGETIVNFETSGWQCVKNTTYSSWVNGANVIPYTSGSYNCSLHSSDIGGACCPGGQVCNPSGSCGPQNSDFCWQYSSPETCKNALLGIGETSVIDDTGDPTICSVGPIYVSGGVQCVNSTGCSCKWTSGACVSNADVKTICANNVTTNRGVCWWDVTDIEDNCNSTLNTMLLKKQANWEAAILGVDLQPSWCADVDRIYQCPANVRLPFFTGVNFLLTLLFVALGYTIYSLKRKN